MTQKTYIFIRKFTFTSLFWEYKLFGVIINTEYAGLDQQNWPKIGIFSFKHLTTLQTLYIQSTEMYTFLYEINYLRVYILSVLIEIAITQLTLL